MFVLPNVVPEKYKSKYSVCTSGWVGKVTDLSIFELFNFVIFPPDDWYRFDPNLSVPVAG